MCPWESQQTWGRIYLLGKKCSLRQMMVPFRISKTSNSQYCSDGLSTKALLTDTEKWSHSASLRQIQSGHQEWRNIFFDCFNLFYNCRCSECSLSKSRLPIAVSDWIWRLKCFRYHSSHCNQHHPKTAISSISAFGADFLREKKVSHHK